MTWQQLRAAAAARPHPQRRAAPRPPPAMSSSNEDLRRHLLSLQQAQLDAIGCLDYEAYADTCAPDMSCFEAEAKGHQIVGVSLSQSAAATCCVCVFVVDQQQPVSCPAPPALACPVLPLSSAKLLACTAFGNEKCPGHIFTASPRPPCPLHTVAIAPPRCTFTR